MLLHDGACHCPWELRPRRAHGSITCGNTWGAQVLAGPTARKILTCVPIVLGASTTVRTVVDLHRIGAGVRDRTGQQCPMAKRPDLSGSQKKIVDRYYQNRETIGANRLGELISELYLAVGDEKKSARLWKQAATALKNTGQTSAQIERIVAARDLETLARLAK